MNVMLSGDEDSDILVCVAVTPVTISTSQPITIGLTTVNSVKAGK